MAGREQARKANRSGGRGNLAEIAFQTLRREIVGYKLLPDTVLTETSLAARFDMSRVPIREALKRLGTVGLVRSVPRVGYIVTNVSIRDYDEIMTLRLALEPVATELAVTRLTPAENEKLTRLAAEVPKIIEDEGPDRGQRLAQNNTEFHVEIAKISGNSRLYKVIGNLLDELERVMHMLAYSPPSILDSVVNDHMILTEMMRTGDAKTSADLMRDQIQHDYEVMRSLAIRASGASLTTGSPVLANPW